MWKIGGSLSETKGSLYWDGHLISGLAEKFGTPLYVYSEERLRENYRRLHDAFSKNYENFRLYYAIKSNNNLSVLKILRREGAGADCSSPAEILFAKKAGFDNGSMLYTGNYNTDDEFRFAIREGVTLNLDDISHISRVEKIKKQKIACLRINPGIGKGEFPQITTGGPDAKFGIPFEKAVEAYAELKRSGVEEFGIHMMTGSNVLDAEYFREITSKLLDIAGDVSRKVGIKFSFINIGGGFGIPYRPREPNLDIEYVGYIVTKTFKEKCDEHSLGRPQLRIEPGRYIIGDAGILIARVTSIKDGYKKFIGCDAGMNTLIRPALYGAYHHIFVDGRVDKKGREGQHKGPLETVNICGQICENADQFAKDRKMPKATSEGDLLVFLNCGAYGFGMSSQYNSRPRAAEILTNKLVAMVIREKETELDLLERQRVPDHLK
jgi:diaminopimelate decarboxylase